MAFVACAGVAELVDALDLGSSDASRGGSNPSARTILANYARYLRTAPFVGMPDVLGARPDAGAARIGSRGKKTGF